MTLEDEAKCLMTALRESWAASWERIAADFLNGKFKAEGEDGEVDVEWRENQI